MCWSAEVSALSAVAAWGVCAYLYYRNLNFDRWASAYLFTFTLTQVVDVFLWLDEGKVGLSTCSDLNYGTPCIPYYFCAVLLNFPHCMQEFRNLGFRSLYSRSISSNVSTPAKSLPSTASRSRGRTSCPSSAWPRSLTAQVSQML